MILISRGGIPKIISSPDVGVERLTGIIVRAISLLRLLSFALIPVLLQALAKTTEP